MADHVELQHNKVTLALHPLRSGSGRPLLLLHGLGERSPGTVPPELEAWPGPVFGLDFTGHGCSTVPVGGGYTAELLMADADHALAHLGPVTIYGRGLGGYVGLLLAGARPADVRGVIVADGPGLSGGGPRPGTLAIIRVDDARGEGAERAAVPPDPFALAELSRDVRPPDYAAGFAREAVQNSALDVPIAVTALARPEWLAAVANEFGVGVMDLDAALALFAGS